jgi:hypothetical protein
MNKHKFFKGMLISIIVALMATSVPVGSRSALAAIRSKNQSELSNISYHWWGLHIRMSRDDLRFAVGAGISIGGSFVSKQTIVAAMAVAGISLDAIQTGIEFDYEFWSFGYWPISNVRTLPEGA